jgi:hypothetical protein
MSVFRKMGPPGVSKPIPPELSRSRDRDGFVRLFPWPDVTASGSERDPLRLDALLPLLSMMPLSASWSLRTRSIGLKKSEPRPVRIRLCTLHSNLHGGNIPVNGAGTPVIITDGEVGEGSALGAPTGYYALLTRLAGR